LQYGDGLVESGFGGYSRLAFMEINSLSVYIPVVILENMTVGDGVGFFFKKNF